MAMTIPPPGATPRLNTLRLYLVLLASFTLFWWPLSHWFYPDWYHHLLGFTHYDYALVKIIGTLGVMPVLGMLFVARDPLRNRDLLITLLLLFTLFALTDIFLITTHGFPRREWINVALLLCNSALLAGLYPWTQARTT